MMLARLEWFIYLRIHRVMKSLHEVDTIFFYHPHVNTILFVIKGDKESTILHLSVVIQVA